MKKYRFVLVPPPIPEFDTGIDIYDCFGGSSPYVVKHDRLHDTWECSCADYAFRRRRAHENCIHITALKAEPTPQSRAESSPQCHSGRT